MTISCEAKVDDGFTEFNFEHRCFELVARIRPRNRSMVMLFRPLFRSTFGSIRGRAFVGHSLLYVPYTVRMNADAPGLCCVGARRSWAVGLASKCPPIWNKFVDTTHTSEKIPIKSGANA